jgi:small subunit ribosomal protein S6
MAAPCSSPLDGEGLYKPEGGIRMRKYETFFIIDPDLTEEAYNLAGEKLKGIVNANSGTVLTYVPWGKKKLAYPVKKRTQGLYILMEYCGGPELVAELERNMRLDERFLKFITVKLLDRFDPAKEEERESAVPVAFEEETADMEKEEPDEYESEADAGLSAEGRNEE